MIDLVFGFTKAIFSRKYIIEWLQSNKITLINISLKQHLAFTRNENKD